MGQYDKQIDAAKKIGMEWIKKSKQFEDQLYTVKKGNLKMEKDIITSIQNDINQGKTSDAALVARHLQEVQKIKSRINIFVAQGQSIYDEHRSWQLKEPRDSMKVISQKLKLGKATDEDYKAVAKGIGNQLTEVASVLKVTDAAWTRDLKPALDNQMDRVNALEKILKGESSKSSAFMQQIRSESDRFVKLCDQLWSSIGAKLPGHVDDRKKLQAKEFDDKPDQFVAQKYVTFDAAMNSIPKLRAEMNKNHQRVLKSVPKNFIDGFFASKEKKLMDAKVAEIDGKLKAAEKFYAVLVKEWSANPTFKTRGLKF